VAINDYFLAVAVAVVIPVLYDNGVPIPMFVAFTDNSAIVVSITVSIMANAHCHSYRTDTDPDFFCTRGHYNTNACNGGNNQSEFH
jgi:hypothetical protein